MPPNQTTRPRGRPPGAANKSKASASSTKNASQARASTSSRASGSGSAMRKTSRPEPEDMEIDPFASSQEPDEPSTSRRRGRQPQEDEDEEAADQEDEDEDDDPPKTIPPELLTRLLHEFFERDGTRVSRAANDAVARYMDIFVREAIARAAVEKEGGFLEVEDLEKIAPQLLLDL